VRASNRTSVGEYTVSLVTADVGEDCADFVCKLYSKSLESSLSDVTPKHLWVSLDKFAREERSVSQKYPPRRFFGKTDLIRMCQQAYLNDQI
jgi:hypothetical protein